MVRKRGKERGPKLNKKADDLDKSTAFQAVQWNPRVQQTWEESYIPKKERYFGKGRKPAE